MTNDIALVDGSFVGVARFTLADGEAGDDTGVDGLIRDANGPARFDPPGGGPSHGDEHQAPVDSPSEEEDDEERLIEEEERKLEESEDEETPLIKEIKRKKELLQELLAEELHGSSDSDPKLLPPSVLPKTGSQ